MLPDVWYGRSIEAGSSFSDRITPGADVTVRCGDVEDTITWS
jgi:hypothetical protein